MAVLVIGGVVLAWYYSPSVSDLESFVKLTEQDPLFYSPFMDYDQFITSINSLSEAETQLKETIIDSIKDDNANYTNTFVALYENHQLFPTEYLEQLAATTRLTDIFLAEPTPKKAKELIDNYEKTAAAYVEAAKSGVEVFKTIDSYMRSDRPLVYFFVGSATTKDIVQHDYQLIAKNATALQEEVERRRNCLFGKDPCKPIDNSSNTDDLLSTLNEEIPPENSRTAFVKDTLPGAGREPQVRGPYKAKSSCWYDATEEPWFYLVYSKEPGYSTLVMPKLSSQNYYRTVSASTTDPIGQAALDMNLSFYSQLETTTYECTDLTFYPDLLTIDFMADQINTENLTLEDISSNIKYSRLLENRFSFMAPAFEALASYTRLLEASQRAESSLVISPQFLFSTRSAYSLTFMPFAKSIWRIDDQPKYLVSDEQYGLLGAGTGYASYDELKEQGNSDEDIKRSHLNQAEVVNSLIE